MKRLIYIFVTLLMVVATGCKKESPAPKVDNAAKLVGAWHCTPEEMDVDVYVEFAEDKSFDLYQRVGEGRYRHYTGTWSVEGNIVSGVYEDGAEWGSSYAVTFADADNMTFTAQNGSDETLNYTRTTIPDEIKEESVAVRSIVENNIVPIL